MSFTFAVGGTQYSKFESPSPGLITVQGSSIASDCLIGGVDTPVNTTDAANKAYVDLIPFIGVSVDYTAQASDSTIGVDSTGGVVTITIPSIASFAAVKRFTVVDVAGAAGDNNITVVLSGADTIYGEAAVLINRDYEAITLMSDGTSKWYIS